MSFRIFVGKNSFGEARHLVSYACVLSIRATHTHTDTHTPIKNLNPR
uniref:Uncharacterized protein n=1 Tax=Anguilla anguilla TaxID=7936 RepID=A0A0E9RWW9_ANGAN